MRNIDLGDDPRPFSMPKQIAGTDANLADQTTEGVNNPGWLADRYDTDVDVVTPKAFSAGQVVTRQMLDMSNPAVDSLIFGDLIAARNSMVENRVGAACLNAAIVAATFATEAAFTGVAPATPAIDAIIDASVAVRTRLHRPARLLALGTRRWGAFKKLKDTSGRPLIPSGSGGPMNVPGVGSIQTDGQIEDLGMIVTDGVNNSAAYPDGILVLDPAEVILWETSLLQFRFEEIQGPSNVVLGVWGYMAISPRRIIAAGQTNAGKSAAISSIAITAAS